MSAVNQISNESILKATGKYWEKWFSIILKAGGKKLSHQEIVLVLHKYLKGTGWWEQMITVQFDKKYKNRALYQSGKTFKVSISKVFNFPIERVFDSWINKPVISKWLTNKSFTIRKSTSQKSLRLIWVDYKTFVDVDFYVKSKGETTVVVQFSKLPSADECEKKKVFMKRANYKLEKLLSK